MRSGRCRRQPKATLRLYKPRQMAVGPYPLGPSDAGRMFCNAHVRISGHAGRSGKESIITAPAGFRLSGRKRFRQLCARAAAFAARQGKPPPRKLQHFYWMLQKTSRLRLIMEKGTSQERFFAEGKKRKKGRTALKKRNPFTVCLHHTAVRAWEQSSTQKRNLFSERKSSMESDDSMELWSECNYRTWKNPVVSMVL